MSISLTISSLVCGWKQKKKEIPILNSGKINIDLTINLSILPIFGRTGFGKTTLLHVLSGIMPPLSGSVSWKLPKKKQISWSSQKQPLNLLQSGNFGIMMQGAELPRFMTIGEAIKLKIHYQSKSNNIKKKKIEESISRFCLSNEDPKRCITFPSTHLEVDSDGTCLRLLMIQLFYLLMNLQEHWIGKQEKKFYVL